MSKAQEISGSSFSDIAPTPQNTPAAHLSHSVMSRPQVPATLEEVDEEEEAAAPADQAAALAQMTNNPAFAALVQNRLDSLVGQSSGYVESLPVAIRRRIVGLEGLQVEHAKLESEFQREIFELEKRFASRYQPLYARRKELIQGVSEPTAEEVTRGEEQADSEDEEEGPVPAPTAEDLKAAPKGIPQFWLTAIKNHLGLSELVTEEDEGALKYLIDIRVVYPETKPGFSLVFEFEDGAKEYFSNQTLTKSYYYQDEVGYEGDFVYDHAEGTEINWVEGKNLTVTTETRKQRNKKTNQTRVVTKTVPKESFFTFFSPPKVPSEDDSDLDIDEDIDEKLELDYQIGEDLKERLVPRAVDFFTGKALRYEDGEEEDDDFEFDDEDDVEDDSDSDGAASSGKAPAPPSGVTPTSNQDPQECNQQ